jgi:hypothetical protein
MKLDYMQEKPAFRPQVLTITFDSQEEVDLFEELMDRSAEVATKLFSKNAYKKDKLKDMMGDIYGIIPVREE